MTQNSTYNGWTNYATWRINLELIQDDETWTERAYQIRQENDGEISPSEFGDEIQEATEELLSDMACVKYGESNLVLDYAMAFLGEVDWTQTARHIIADLEPYEDEE